MTMTTGELPPKYGRTQSGKVFMPGGYVIKGRKRAERQSKNTSYPVWARIGFYCEAHMRNDGHCPLRAGQLATDMGCSVKRVREEVKRAIAEGELREGSIDRCLIAQDETLYEVGASAQPCGWH